MPTSVADGVGSPWARRRRQRPKRTHATTRWGELYYAAHAVVDIWTENANNDSKRNELETLPNRDTHEGIANARAALLRPAAQASCAAFTHQPDDVARPRPASELDTLQCLEKRIAEAAASEVRVFSSVMVVHPAMKSTAKQRLGQKRKRRRAMAVEVPQVAPHWMFPQWSRRTVGGCEWSRPSQRK